MNEIITQKFFNRPTLRVAKELLGKFLVRRIGRTTISGMIIEVETYVGPSDKASHASRGKTKRTEVMFGKAGNWYVYLVYGMHHCLNIVTEREHYPAAILIRSIAAKKSARSRDFFHIRGPGRVCRYFKVDARFNKTLAGRKAGLWIEDRGIKINPREIQRGKRIGVEYAGRWKDKLWRFSLG